ncbi:unnamed protein product [Mytilus coruscus]|uniref:Uncharacterized protein n=1 Tax=Mytilus coruscus TaxID=42192 RepID=A0A6J8CUP4_MYTCO|nr:unnamed protein product [Mytilus coruscus]
MENNEALAGISSGYGIRVDIHEQNTLPFPTEEGFLVSTAFETHIALKKIDILRSDGNHGDCNTYADFEAEYGYKFTRQLCLALCLQDEMLERCGCHSSTLEEYRVKLHKNHTRMCRSKSVNDEYVVHLDRECEALVKLEQRRRLVPCRCTNPCKETRYSRVITARQWPTDEYANILVASVCEQRPEVCNHIVNKKKDSRSLSQDFLRLTIYYEDLNYEEMYETPEIEVQQFASDVGGAIGLWIGLSILSVFELVQLAMELCVVGKRKLF